MNDTNNILACLEIKVDHPIKSHQTLHQEPDGMRPTEEPATPRLKREALFAKPQQNKPDFALKSVFILSNPK